MQGLIDFIFLRQPLRWLPGEHTHESTSIYNLGSIGELWRFSGARPNNSVYLPYFIGGIYHGYMDSNTNDIIITSIKFNVDPPFNNLVDKLGGDWEVAARGRTSCSCVCSVRTGGPPGSFGASDSVFNNNPQKKADNRQFYRYQ